MSYFTEFEQIIIDKTTWTKNLDNTNLEELTPGMINKHLLYNFWSYQEYGKKDEDLWERFTTSFSGWTKEIFEKAKSKLVVNV